MSTNPTSITYDTLPYPPYSYPATHVGRLGAIGRIFGIPTSLPANARVLELGCGIGVNTLAMAQLFPTAEFIGIDASAKQIEIGNKAIEVTGIKNVRLITADFTKLEEDLGQFDYVVAHGIYSWVGAEAKEAILSICSKNLKPEGLAYVSYNCLPGWRMRSALRDMMLMHTAGIPDVGNKIVQAKALIKFLSESCPEETPYGTYLRQELDTISKADDGYIAHEFLEDENEALYFTDFLKAAGKHGLTYLADADPATMITDNLPEKAAATLNSLNLNLLATEQYMDFVRNRMFRSTILVHGNSAINRSIHPDRLEGLYVSSLIGLKQAFQEGGAAIFTNGIADMSVSEPYSAEIFSMIAAQGGESRPVKELIDQAVAAFAKKLKPNDKNALREDIGRILVHGYLRRMLDFTLGPLAACTTTSSNPETLPLARCQAANNIRITTRSLGMVTADSFVARMVLLCDGTRDRAAIIASMLEAVTAQQMQLNENNQPVTDPERAKLILESLYDGSIQNLAVLGLLMAKAA